MRFLLLAAAATALLAGGAAATLAISGNSLAVADGSTTSTLPSVDPARTTEDVSGPCDEAEHANDPRCAGTTTTTKPAAKAIRREDRSGHRHRHGGRQSRAVDDNSGRGSDDTSGHRGGANSGRGGSDDGGGHGGSGHGGGGRDHPEDD